MINMYHDLRLLLDRPTHEDQSAWVVGPRNENEDFAVGYIQYGQWYTVCITSSESDAKLIVDMRRMLPHLLREFAELEIEIRNLEQAPETEDQR